MQKINNERFTLSESPIWHPIRQCFYWVDIVTGRVLFLSDKKERQTIQLSDKVGCIVPTSDGHLLAALSQQIIKINLDNAQQTPLSDKLISDDEMFNDGNVDAKGRFWVATKHINEQSGLGCLYVFDGHTLIKKEHDLIVGNGIDWSVDNQTLYLCDSPRQCIYAYDFNLAQASISNKRIFKCINNGYPDGMTVTSDDKVLSAHWAGKCISVYDNKATLIERIEFAAENITSVTLGGENGNTMLVTSAARDVPPTKLQDDGYCFVIDSPYTAKAVNCFLVSKAP